MNSDKIEVLVLAPHATRKKLSDYIVTLDDLSERDSTRDYTSCVCVWGGGD